MAINQAPAAGSSCWVVSENLAIWGEFWTKLWLFEGRFLLSLEELVERGPMLNIMMYKATIEGNNSLLPLVAQLEE